LRPVFDVCVDHRDLSVAGEGRPGAILVGESPVHEVRRAAARIGGGAGGGAAEDGIFLTWVNADAYSSIRLERDGATAAEVAGDSTSFIDPAPGPGIHRYRIVALKDSRKSFPTVITAMPRGVPGSFLRGDVDSSSQIDITDVLVLLSHLFQGGIQPSCLDAADADDSGTVDMTDALAILGHLFLGGGPLPAPGTDVPWLDPTPDDLSCE
jgi:dockerin type I repeat protein